MAANLEVDNSLSATAQSVRDQNGTSSSLAFSTDAIGIGTTVPEAKLHIDGSGNKSASKVRRLEMPTLLT